MNSVAPALVALAVWAVGAAAGLLVRATWAEKALSAQVQVLPLLVGVVVALPAAWYATRGRGPVVAGALLGALGGVVTFALLTILAGTPYGVGSVYGDCGRTLAAAQQYRWSAGSNDQFIAGLPAQYPPLWFWLWGRGAALVGREAYQVQGIVQALGLGLLPLAVGCAWRQVVSWGRAVAATAVTFGLMITSLGYDPCKGHEIGAALLSLPALLLAHTVLMQAVDGRRQLARAALAGVLLGVAFLLYQLFVLFSAPALLVLWGFHAARAKAIGRTLQHLAVLGAAGFVTTSWYVLPFIAEILDKQFPRAADPLMVLYSLQSTPGVAAGRNVTVGVVVLTAVVLVAVRQRTTLTQGILAIAAGAFAVQVLGLLSVVAGRESLYSYRTQPWLIVVCGAAVVLLLPAAARSVYDALPRRPADADLRRAGAALLAIVLLLGVHRTWQEWHAPILGVEARAADYPELGDDGTARAYLAPLPSCNNVAGLPRGITANGCFPGEALQRCLVEAQGGPPGRPVLIAYDDRAGSLFGNHLFLGTNGGATGPFDAWEQRFGVVRSLAAHTDPKTFLEAVRNTGFGPVDGFVLAQQDNGAWRWIAQTYRDKAVVDFSPALFPESDWHLCRSGPTVIALRR